MHDYRNRYREEYDGKNIKSCRIADEFEYPPEFYREKRRRKEQTKTAEEKQPVRKRENLCRIVFFADKETEQRQQNQNRTERGGHHRAVRNGLRVRDKAVYAYTRIFPVDIDFFGEVDILELFKIRQPERTGQSRYQNKRKQQHKQKFRFLSENGSVNAEQRNAQNKHHSEQTHA